MCAQIKSEHVLRSNSAVRKTSDSNYGRSWVFESDGTTGGPGSCNAYASAESLSAIDLRPPTAVATAATVCNRTVTLKRRSAKPAAVAAATATPVVIVEMDRPNPGCGRPTQMMTSFSRTPSPVGLSESSSQDSVSAAAAHAPIYECLEKLTEPSVYRSRLNTALSVSVQESNYAAVDRPPRRLSPTPPPAAEPVQYASLMEELQKTIGNRLSKHVESPEER